MNNEFNMKDFDSLLERLDALNCEMQNLSEEDTGALCDCVCRMIDLVEDLMNLLEFVDAETKDSLVELRKTVLDKKNELV